MRLITITFIVFALLLVFSEAAKAEGNGSERSDREGSYKEKTNGRSDKEGSYKEKTNGRSDKEGSYKEKTNGRSDKEGSYKEKTNGRSDKEGSYNEKTNGRSDGSKPGTIVGAYEKVSKAEYQKNQEIQSLLKYGYPYVVDRAIQDKKIPKGDRNKFRVIKINSVQRQVVSGWNYKFDVILSNCRGTTIKTVFVVYYQSWTNTRKFTLVSYSVKKKNY